ncbi:hypothetical protein TNCV_250361 [Trichonephila clavipes]|nr:hypothetical protein TNCV_250361 [Trichonephila clavipes]
MGGCRFLYHENPSTWAGIKPANLGVEGVKNLLTSRHIGIIFVLRGYRFNWFESPSRFETILTRFRNFQARLSAKANKYK